jgi:AcrR family transcriptional regulator
VPVDLASADADAQTAIRRRASMLPPEERRAAIVRATVPLLVEHGEMVTTRQIADAAGIAEGTIFRVFADKDELIRAVLEAVFDPTPLDDAIRAIDPGMAFEPGLRHIVDLVQRRAIEIWRVASSVGPRFHDVARPGTTLSEPLVAWLRTHKAELRIPSTDAARLLRALTISLTHPTLVEEPMPPKRIVDLFLHGAGAR